MATASRSRRPVMATPPPKSRSDVNTYSIEEKQQLLDNFDLEVEDKIRSFESHLALTLQSFVLRQDSELFRIPRELRSMTLRDLQKSWGGSLSGTVMRLKRDRIEMEERERMEREEEERKAKETEAKGKRKLEDLENSPGRSKNARKDGKSTTTAKGGKRKATTVKKGKSAPSRTSTSQPSGLPQNHIFNPLLPQTPRLPRAPRRGESFLSVNGSPLARPGTTEDDAGADLDLEGETETIREDEEDEEKDSDDDLPDPKAYEAKLAKSQRTLTKPINPTTAASSSSGRTKRGPSLMFRQSLAPPTFRDEHENEQNDDAGEKNDQGLVSIPLKDGRVMSFNPLELSPGRIADEMRESGLGDKELEATRARIKEEVVKALSERMEKWSGLG